MVKFHLFATEPQYDRHVRAVWKHLPDELRGDEFTGRAAAMRSVPAKDYAIIGGSMDIDRVQRHRLIYVEHGAGQTYLGEGWRKHAELYAHAHSTHPDRVIAYISPRAGIAEAWGRPAFAAGCPAIDELVEGRSFSRNAVITFHWDARLIAPEARSARDHWINHLHEVVQRLVEADFTPVGHAHPRDRDAMGIWHALGIPFERDPDRVLTDASLLIADNTSLMYEAAALHIPVIVLNAPWYRKTVNHGLRFWDQVPGVQCDDIEDFVAIDLQEYAFEDPWAWQRCEAACAAYDEMPDGKAGERAARWLVDTLAN